MRIITSGYPFIDIDAYGAMVAYAALLNIQGQPSKAATSSKLNESIPVTLRNLRAPVELNYLPNPGESFTLVDVSDPNHFDPIVNPDRIDEVIDHHPGNDNYWRDYPRNRIDIEMIGSVCTMMYERWARAGLLSTMDRVTATLLAAGILDNTLNFQAKITSERDQQAYRDLQGIAHLSSDWPAYYFSDCQQGIEKDLETAIRNDTKVVEFQGQPNVYAVGQIVIWDAQSIINDHMATIKRTVSSIQPTWFMNVVSIKGDKSYFVCDNPHVQNWLSNLLGINFSGNVAPANRLWLRKEIMIQALKQHHFN
jgi:inorganic pyrophosphatase/exopolyphosphatase